ncbi:MAG: hypothetical protein OHK0024_08330 [Thalassobaculales bacterium]
MSNESDVMDAHARAIGYLSWAWADLHRHLGNLFSAIMRGGMDDVALAAWNAVRSDSELRRMLRAAAEAQFRTDALLKKEIDWLVNTIDRASIKRNKIIHGQFSLLFSDSDIVVIQNPDTDEVNSTITEKIDKTTRYLESLSGFAAQLFPCVVESSHRPLPQRPHL